MPNTYRGSLFVKIETELASQASIRASGLYFI